MQTRGVLVDYRAVNTAMSACSKAQQWGMVLKLYDQVRTKRIGWSSNYREMYFTKKKEEDWNDQKNV